MSSIASLLSFQEALDDISNSYLRDVERVVGLVSSQASFQFTQALSEWWDDKLDVFSLTLKIFAVLTEKSALSLLHGLNDILRLRGSLPRLHCSLNNDHDDFIAVINSNGSRIYLPSQLSSPPSTWVFNTEDLTGDELGASALQLDRRTAQWAIQLLHLELNLRYVDISAKKKCMKLLNRLVRKFQVLPPSLFLRNVAQGGQHPVSSGGYADIYKGHLKRTKLDTDSVPVCLKALRVFQSYAYDPKERDKLLKEFCHEAFLWTQLNHPNILPCLGVSMEVMGNRPCLISPWMSNGNIMEFLKLNPRQNRLEAIIGIARGLSYLHGLEPQFVHGDIKGVNILVTEDGRCCLADFGLCLMVESHTVGATSVSSSIKGTTRWLAPEVLDPDEFHRPNKVARDIYAFACTVLEIFTGKPPFADQRTEPAVLRQVLQGKRPPRPTEMQTPWLDNVWEMMQKCWLEDSHSRPHAKDLVQLLEGLSQSLAAPSSQVNHDPSPHVQHTKTSMGSPSPQHQQRPSTAKSTNMLLPRATVAANALPPVALAQDQQETIVRPSTEKKPAPQNLSSKSRATPRQSATWVSAAGLAKRAVEKIGRWGGFSSSSRTSASPSSSTRPPSDVSSNRSRSKESQQMVPLSTNVSAPLVDSKVIVIPPLSAHTSPDDETDEIDEEESLKSYDELLDEEERLIRNGGSGIPIGRDGLPRPLLPQIFPEHVGRKCLVLDLDETLVHSSFQPFKDSDLVVSVEIEDQWHNAYVLKRPGVDTFLEKMGELYEIVLFTASLGKYADPVLDKLDIRQVVVHRLFRESCLNHMGNYVKDLSQLGRPITDVILVDNDPKSYIFNPNNAVPISSWFNDPHDTELTDLIPFLTDLATVLDVRGILDGGR